MKIRRQTKLKEYQREGFSSGRTLIPRQYYLQPYRSFLTQTTVKEACLSALSYIKAQKMSVKYSQSCCIHLSAFSSCEDSKLVLFIKQIYGMSKLAPILLSHLSTNFQPRKRLHLVLGNCTPVDYVHDLPSQEELCEGSFITNKNLSSHIVFYQNHDNIGIQKL